MIRRGSWPRPRRNRGQVRVVTHRVTRQVRREVSALRLEEGRHDRRGRARDRAHHVWQVAARLDRRPLLIEVRKWNDDGIQPRVQRLVECLPLGVLLERRPGRIVGLQRDRHVSAGPGRLFHRLKQAGSRIFHPRRIHQPVSAARQLWRRSLDRLMRGQKFRERHASGLRRGWCRRRRRRTRCEHLEGDGARHQARRPAQKLPTVHIADVSVRAS